MSFSIRNTRITSGYTSRSLSRMHQEKGGLLLPGHNSAHRLLNQNWKILKSSGGKNPKSQATGITHTGWHSALVGIYSLPPAIGKSKRPPRTGNKTWARLSGSTQTDQCHQTIRSRTRETLQKPSGLWAIAICLALLSIGRDSCGHTKWAPDTVMNST